MFKCGYDGCGFKNKNETSIRNHMVREHGILQRYNYQPILCPDKICLKRGQTTCTKCGAIHNNHSRPDHCNCGQDLSKGKLKTQTSAYKLDGYMFSVRKSVRGIAKRIIVDTLQNICYDDECLIARSHFDDTRKFTCMHLMACKDCGCAKVVNIELSKINKFVKSNEVISEIQKKAVGGELSIFVMPDNIAAVPVLQPLSHKCASGFIHISLLSPKCPLKKCSKKVGSHHLVKADTLCIHTMLCKLVNCVNVDETIQRNIFNEASGVQFSKQKTVERVVEKIIKNIPSHLECEKEIAYLQNSAKVQLELFNSKDLSVYDSKFCDYCQSQTSKRNRNPKNCFLVTPGYMIQVKINTFVCHKCEVIIFPDMSIHGFVPITDSLIVSWSLIIDGRNQIRIGTKLYNYFKAVLRRLCLENVECAKIVHTVDFHNLSVKMTKCVVAYNSASLVNCSTSSEDSLALTLCLHCGLFPTILCSDGNAKNSIFIKSASESLSFDKDDKSDILSLNEFLKKCVVSLAGTALFQNFPKDPINVFKIPPILSKVLSSEVRNRESSKRSLFLKDFDLSIVDFNEVTKLVTSGEFDVLKSRKLDLKQLKKIAKQINIPCANQHSKVMLGESLKC